MKARTGFDANHTLRVGQMAHLLTVKGIDMSLRELAAAWGVPRTTLRRRAEALHLRPRLVGRAWYLSWTDIAILSDALERKQHHG